MHLVLISTALVATTQAFTIPFHDQFPLFGPIGRSEIEDLCPRHRIRENKRYGRGEGSIIDVLRKEKQFSKFVGLIEENKGLRDDLEGKEKITLFAPTNEAINKLEKMMEERQRGSGSKRDMEKIIRYHVVKEEYEWDEFFDGQTVTTSLRLHELDGKNQKIRVSKFLGHIVLNMYARVQERNLGASNGVIHAVDSVILPPPDMYETLLFVPSKFSTFIAAVHRADLFKEFDACKGCTVLVPPNNAWENLGVQNLAYLFSERGVKDLKKVIQYHIAESLVYGENLLEKKSMNLKTMLKGEEVKLQAVSWRKQQQGRRNKRYSDDDDDSSSSSEDEETFGERPRKECPADYMMVINNGQATITYNDAIAQNGNMMLISNVLIPADVKLPANH